MNNNDWQKHLDNLEEHYSPDNFFIDQLSKPTNESSIKEHFFTPALTEELEIPEEGQLSIDIFQDEENLYVIAPIAGVGPENLEINLDKDILTIKGKRDKEFLTKEKNYIYHECHWGKFSRSIILPTPVNEKKVHASFKNGVLKIVLPKAPETEKVEIQIEED